MVPSRAPRRLAALSLAFVSFVAIATAPISSANALDVLDCGRHVLYQESLGSVPEGGLVPRTNDTARKNATISLNAGPTLQGNAPALAAYLGAVAIWESVLQDPVSVVINADLIPLPAGVAGTTSSRVFQNGYNTIRNQMVADADAGEALLALMPTSVQFDVELPGILFSYGGQLKATKANLKAMGFDMSFDDANPDAIINFSTALPFDFDPSDGISPGTFDFEALVLHEMGHALGFISEIDNNEFDVLNGTPNPVVVPSALDLFRFHPGSGSANFTTATRIVSLGSVSQTQVFYDGLADRPLSTGAVFGDGRQAGHWKDDALLGARIGIMDPSLAAGERDVLTEEDLRAFGLIGWDVDATPVAVRNVTWGRLRQLLGN